MRTIDITIAYRLPTANELQRMNFHSAAKNKRTLARMIHAELLLARQWPWAEPMQHFTVQMHRSSPRPPDGAVDEDGEKFMAKHILDVMQPMVPAHRTAKGTKYHGRPYGLGIIANDDRKHMRSLSILHIRTKPGTERTRILVQEVPIEVAP